MAELSSNTHVLIFPYPAQGHMIPLLDFTHKLANRHLTITILVTPKNLHYLTPLLTLHPKTITPLVLPFPRAADIPAGVENTVDLPSGGFRLMICALTELHQPLLDWFRSHPAPPTAIVSDMFLGWTQHLAVELGIHRYVFCPSGAFAISVVNVLWRDMRRRREEGDREEVVEFEEIPNGPSYPWWQLSPVYRSYVKWDTDSEVIRDSFLANMASYGYVFNSFDELEGGYLEYLAKAMGNERVWAIGPVLPPDHAGASERGGSSSVVASEILSWLDACQEHSVVYVCFGSQAVLTNKQMEELALGLDKSGVKFILSYKGATKGHTEGDYGVIPEGFEDRVAGRGLIIKGWAPQVPILHHKSVCAFVTHCGWNSTLESIIAGVPMLAWPMGADQFINATLLVEQLDVAVKICEGDKAILHSDDLARFLSDATSGSWIERRIRAKELSKVALGATKEGGSSFKNLDSFARHLSEEKKKSVT